jgi:hypothetical protein
VCAGLEEWFDSEALALEFPEALEAYQARRAEEGAAKEGPEADLQYAKVENLAVIAARVLGSVRWV